MMGPESAPRRTRFQTVGKGPVIGSAAVHIAAILLAWWSTAVPRNVQDFVIFEIELISPPAAELGERSTPPPEELVIERPVDPVPAEEPPPTLVEVDVSVEELPEPEEVSEPEQPVVPTDVALVDDAEPPTSPNPDPDVEIPGEELNIRIEGVRRDYPEYYNNILRQMQRCFRWRGADNLRARVYFVIDKDGSVSEVEILESSRDIGFDIEAMGAAECAGNQNRLGPLPEDLPFDRLPVIFYFEPQSGRGFDSGQ